MNTVVKCDGLCSLQVGKPCVTRESLRQANIANDERTSKKTQLASNINILFNIGFSEIVFVAKYKMNLRRLLQMKKTKEKGRKSTLIQS